MRTDRSYGGEALEPSEPWAGGGHGCLQFVCFAAFPLQKPHGQETRFWNPGWTARCHGGDPSEQLTTGRLTSFLTPPCLQWNSLAYHQQSLANLQEAMKKTRRWVAETLPRGS